MKKQTNKNLIFEIIGNMLAWTLVTVVGFISLISPEVKHYISYGLSTLFIGVIGMLIFTFINFAIRTKKITILNARRMIVVWSLMFLLVIILTLAIFTPQLSFSWIGGIIDIFLLVVANLGALLANKVEYFKVFKKADNSIKK